MRILGNRLPELVLSRQLCSTATFSEADIAPTVIDQVLKQHNLGRLLTASYGDKLLALFELFAEPNFIQPTFAIDYPIETSPLAKRDPQNTAVASSVRAVCCRYGTGVMGTMSSMIPLIKQTGSMNK